MARGAGVGIGGLVLLAMMGMCADNDDYQPASPLLSTSAQAYTAPAPDPVKIEDFYLHGSLNVRSGPGKEYPVLRTLSRGERVRLGPKDAAGWAEIYASGGTANGYVYRASDLVRSQAPTTRAVSRSNSGSGYTPRRSSAASRGYYLGPRGGCYTYSASGRKRYVDRSLCY